jgi:hypothetical protein
MSTCGDLANINATDFQGDMEHGAWNSRDAHGDEYTPGVTISIP